MKFLALIPLIFFLLALPLFLFTTALRGAAGAFPLYQWAFDRHGVAQNLGLEPEELEKAARGLLAYFNSPLEPVRILVRGEELFNEKEKLHLRDVKGLLRLNRLIQTLSLAYILAFMAGNWLWRRKAFWPFLLKALRRSSGLTLFLLLVLGGAAAVGFDRLFLAFHLVSFANPFWQLDPARDRLIVMFPQRFFYDMTLVILATTVLMALALGTGCHLVLHQKSSRRRL